MRHLPDIPPPKPESARSNNLTPSSVTKEMYKLKLNDMCLDINGYRITRVPGGWIYGQYTVFVPFNNEGLDTIQL